MIEHLNESTSSFDPESLHDNKKYCLKFSNIQDLNYDEISRSLN